MEVEVEEEEVVVVAQIGSSSRRCSCTWSFPLR
jgi:hypothetical protein